MTRDGGKVDVVNEDDSTVSVIDTRKNTVIATIPVGNIPLALGIFINAAAAALGFFSVKAPQDAILAFCGG